MFYSFVLITYSKLNLEREGLRKYTATDARYLDRKERESVASEARIGCYRKARRYPRSRASRSSKSPFLFRFTMFEVSLNILQSFKNNRRTFRIPSSIFYLSSYLFLPFLLFFKLPKYCARIFLKLLRSIFVEVFIEVL